MRRNSNNGAKQLECELRSGEDENENEDMIIRNEPRIKSNGTEWRSEKGK